jgi:hypothetical protein
VPQRLRIGCFDVSVEPMPGKLAKRLLGQWVPETQTILLNMGGNPLSLLTTLLHEILHALFWVQCTFSTQVKPPAKVDELEEHVSGPTANGLAQVLRDNPHLRRYLDAVLGDLPGS